MHKYTGRDLYVCRVSYALTDVIRTSTDSYSMFNIHHNITDNLASSVTSIVLSAMVATTLPFAAHAENFELNEAQTIIYATPHLQTLQTGNEITYEFVKASEIEEGFTDTIKLQVVKTHEDERKDVAINFMTGDRNVPYADFTKFRGNPIIMTILERDVSEMRRLTQGGMIYFRNRIRYALAGKAVVESVSIEVDGKKATAQQVTIKPYIGDPMIQRFPMFENKEYKLIISDEVPGGVYEVSTMVPKKDGKGANVTESLQYKSMTESS